MRKGALFARFYWNHNVLVQKIKVFRHNAIFYSTSHMQIAGKWIETTLKGSVGVCSSCSLFETKAENS